jgi:hypothetical protein
LPDDTCVLLGSTDVATVVNGSSPGIKDRTDDEFSSVRKCNWSATNKRHRGLELTKPTLGLKVVAEAATCRRKTTGEWAPAAVASNYVSKLFAIPRPTQRRL